MEYVNIITTTRDRIVALKLLEKWIDRQTWKWINWIIVTDGEITEFPGRGRVIQRRGDVYYDARQNIELVEAPNYHSMLNNLAVGIEIADKESPIIIMEDDEYYAPNYVERCLQALTEVEMVGFAPSHYIHVVDRTYRCMHNASFASLAATAWLPSVTPCVKELIHRNDPYLDGLLWNTWEGSYGIVDNTSEPVNVSFKGLPGARGIGVSHSEKIGGVDWQMTKLRKMVNREAFNEYWSLMSSL